MSAMKLVPLASLFAFAVAAAPREAHATPNFPPAVQAYVKAADAPPCQTCHVGPQQRGTVVTPFGTNMRARGLVAFDEGSLKKALDQMVADKVDSDGDGDTDIDALAAGRSPNVPQDGGVSGGGSGASPLTPQYGCGAHVASHVDASGAGGGAGTIGLALSLALAFGARRARKSRRGGEPAL
jgi:hypothetical protein